ncbi:MAG: nuclear transport factor 2 family protein, partial [Acidobacteriota bacterium]
MRKIPTVAFALLIPLAACKKKENAGDHATPKPAPGSGSAAMTGSGSAAAGAPKPVEAKPVTGEDLAKRYVECWELYNAKDFEKLKTCFASPTTEEIVDAGPPGPSTPDETAKGLSDLVAMAPDRKVELELTLVNGKHVASVGLYSGTHAKTSKKFGLQIGYVVHFTDDGKTVDRTSFYLDQGEMGGQVGAVKMPVRPVADKPWGANEIVVAKDDDTEKKNLEAVKKMTDAFDKHDAKAIEAMLADDLVWSESGVPKDWNKKQAVAAHADLFKGFSDLKLAPD